MNIELNDEEFETLKDIFNDWGSDCPYTDYNKRQALGEKLGILEPIKPPTEEELKRREEFAKLMRPILEATNHLLKGITEAKIDILYGVKHLSGRQLKIRLPNDYLVK